MKTVVVTGGAGFIGSHLCDRLAKQGHRVISLDHYFAGSKANHVPGVEYREGHTKDIETLIPESPDRVFHLGEYARVEISLSEPKIVWDLNVAGTFAVVEFWRKHECKLIYSGSSTKFGDGGLGRDQTPYAWTKAINTELIQNYSAWYSLPFAITYFYNVYGERERSAQHYGTVIQTFIEKHKAGEPLPVVSPGTQKRNFTHVEDIVDGLMLVGEKGEGDNFGLGNKKEYSILDLAGLFRSPITMLPERAGNRMSAALDTSRSEALGWHASCNLEDYIHEIIKKT